MDIDKRSHLLKSGIHDFMQDKSTKLDSNAGYMYECTHLYSVIKPSIDRQTRLKSSSSSTTKQLLGHAKYFFAQTKCTPPSHWQYLWPPHEGAAGAAAQVVTAADILY